MLGDAFLAGLAEITGKAKFAGLIAQNDTESDSSAKLNQDLDRVLNSKYQPPAEPPAKLQADEQAGSPAQEQVKPPAIDPIVEKETLRRLDPTLGALASIVA